MLLNRRIRLPLFAGVGGSLFLSMVYMGIVSLAESPMHAIELFWQDRLFVFPIILGFGVQVGLYTILKNGLYVPMGATHVSGHITSASGVTSTTAMAACCAHHVTDVLPILGLTTAATFLAEYKTAFMVVGLGTTLIGIAVMVRILIKERRKYSHPLQVSLETS